MKKIASIICLAFSVNALAQTGLEYLDATFNNTGYAIDNDGMFDYIKGMAIKPDDKIVFTGSSDLSTIALICHNPDGSIDQSFGNNGRVVATGYDSTYQRYSTVNAQADGKVILAYSSYPINNDTVVNDENWLYIQRYNANGTLDNTFGTGGSKIIPFNNYEMVATRILPMNDGSTIISGTRNAGIGTEEAILIKLTPNGQFDTTFGANGFCILYQGGSIFFNQSATLDNSGNIYICGRLGSSGCIIKVLSTGLDFDNSFGTAGIYYSNGTTNFGITRVIIRPDGKLLMLGGDQFGNAFISVANTDGTTDTQFGVNGIKQTGYQDGDCMLLADGKILVVNGKYNSPGNADIVLMLYNTTGQQNLTFGNNGEVVVNISNDSPQYIGQQSNGRVIVGGGYKNIAVEDTANSSDYLLLCYYPVNSILNSVQTQPANSFTVYPNPVINQINIIRPNNNNRALTHTLYTTQGQLVQQATITNASGNISINIPTELPAGIYYLNLMDSNTNYTTKFIKQ
jgi:uncharacterized delta-60 repeat protein